MRPPSFQPTGSARPKLGRPRRRVRRRFASTRYSPRPSTETASSPNLRPRGKRSARRRDTSLILPQSARVPGACPAARLLVQCFPLRPRQGRLRLLPGSRLLRAPIGAIRAAVVLTISNSLFAVRTSRLRAARSSSTNHPPVNAESVPSAISSRARSISFSSVV